MFVMLYRTGNERVVRRARLSQTPPWTRGWLFQHGSSFRRHVLTKSFMKMVANFDTSQGLYQNSYGDQWASMIRIRKVGAHHLENGNEGKGAPNFSTPPNSGFKIKVMGHAVSGKACPDHPSSCPGGGVRLSARWPAMCQVMLLTTIWLYAGLLLLIAMPDIPTRSLGELEGFCSGR